MIKSVILDSLTVFFFLHFLTIDNSKPVVMQVQTQNPSTLKLFLCGDVMTGRGIDQILPHTSHPVLYESYVKDAQDYVSLAERKNGPIQKPVAFEYIWGDAIKIWDKMNPDLKIINLETALTTHPQPWPNKGINYRMHPKNIGILKVAGIDFCSLANNHTIDWQREGLLETLKTIQNADIKFSGAGIDEESAQKPSVLKANTGRVLVWAYGAESSGIPKSWQADINTPGLNILPTNTTEALQHIKKEVANIKNTNDIVVVSIHWGGNWGYEIPENHQLLAHQLIDTAGVDVIHGHSSHHPLGIEVYKNKLILYGAGDFINDYEGISGHEKYKGELRLMYFPEINQTNGNLHTLKLFPLKMKNFKLIKATPAEAQWLTDMLNREGIPLGTRVVLNKDNSMDVLWN